jgi:hypothetical protein
MEQLIALLIFGAVAFLKWLADRPQQERDQDSQPSQPVFRPAPQRPRQQPAAESEEERVRKFMEALGLPAGAPPPQSLPRRPPQQPKRPGPAPRQTSPVAPRQIRPQNRPANPPLTPPAREEVRPSVFQESPAPQYAAPQYEVAMSAEPQAPAPAPVSPSTAPAPQALPSARSRPESLAVSLLKQPESLRTAFILREILGQPRSLQGDLRESLP